MSEFIEHGTRVTRREALKMSHVRAAVGFLANRYTQEPFPAMSTHYRAPSELTEPIADAPVQLILPITHREFGWDSEGRYVDREV